MSSWLVAAAEGADNSPQLSTWLVALVGGAIGSIVTWLIALAGRVAAVRREVNANDRALHVIDDHLATWVGDDTVRLRRQLHAITEEANRHGLLWSGEHGLRIALAKEQALQAYRDQERTARSQEADIGAREGWLHALLRAWAWRDFGLQTPEQVQPILDEWAKPVTRHLTRPTDPPLAVDDPRQRTVEHTLTDLSNDPKALA